MQDPGDVNSDIEYSEASPPDGAAAPTGAPGSVELDRLQGADPVLAGLREQAQRENLLNRITTAVRESLVLNEILETTVRVLGTNLDLCRCYIAFVDKQRRIVRVVHEYYLPEVGSTLGEFAMGTYGPALLAQMESGDILAVDDVASDPRVAPFRDRILSPLNVRSLMYVPVLSEKRLVAVIGFSQCRFARQWEAAEISLAREVAGQVAVAMRQAQLYEQQRRAAEYRNLINQINRTVRASLDIDTIMQATVEALGQALDVDRCYALGPGPLPATLESATVRFEYCKPGVASVRGLKVPTRNRAREGPVGMIEEPLAIADIVETPRLVSRRKAELLSLTETRAMLSVRAVFGEQVLAVLELNQCYSPRQWSVEEIDLASEVADQLAVGISQALLFRRVTESEQQWNTTFNSMTDGLALLDPTGRIMRVNDSLLKLCNLERAEEAMGRDCYALLYGDPTGIPDSPVERVLATGQKVQIERDIASRGISLRESIDPIFDSVGQIAGLVLVIRDVTREREADRAIRYRNRQLAALNAIAAATTHSLDILSILEGAFARIIDVTSADAGTILLLDDTETQLDPVATHGGAARVAPLVDRDPASKMTATVLTADAPVSFDEFPLAIDRILLGIPSPLEQAGMVSALYAPIRSQQRALGLMVIAYASRRAFSANERQLLAVAGQQIGAAVENARLVANLQHALERVREANRLKDEFMAVVSHELRTPLTAIQGWAEVLGDPDLSNAERSDGLKIIQQASESLTRLISDLLEMSRIETRMLRLEKGRIDPNYPVKAAVQTVRHMADEKGIALELNLTEHLPPIDADSNRLQQVLWNLLVNAIKFTPSGGRVWVSTTAPTPDEIVVGVRDNGIGVDKEFLPYVFERFRQADSSATRHYGGLGIGLSLVKSLVEAHGGTVSVESSGLGRGTTFTVVLPAADAAPPRSERL